MGFSRELPDTYDSYLGLGFWRKSNICPLQHLAAPLLFLTMFADLFVFKTMLDDGNNVKLPWFSVFLLINTPQIASLWLFPEFWKGWFQPFLLVFLTLLWRNEFSEILTLPFLKGFPVLIITFYILFWDNCGFTYSCRKKYKNSICLSPGFS